MHHSGCCFYGFLSHLPFSSLPPDLGGSSLPEDLYPLRLATFGLRGAVQEHSMCWGSDSPLLPGLCKPCQPWFEIRIFLILGTYSHVIWCDLIKTSLPCLLLWHVPPKKTSVLLQINILYAVELNGHIFQFYLHSHISFNDFWNQNNGLYPLIKDSFLHCTVLECQIALLVLILGQNHILYED